MTETLFISSVQRELAAERRAIRDFVLGKSETRSFLEEYFRFLKYLVPRYREEGRAYLTIGIGCTGGRHRSVVIARATADFLKEQGCRVTMRNRDVQGD